MKTILLFLLTLPMICSAQMYVGAQTGLTFAKGYNKVKKVESFAPRTFLFSMPIGYQYGNWLIEAEPGYTAMPFVKMQIGYKWKPFEFLAGTNDNIALTLKGKWQMVQQFAPEGTLRIFFAKDFCVEFSGSKGVFSIGIGGKGFTSE